MTITFDTPVPRQAEEKSDLVFFQADTEAKRALARYRVSYTGGGGKVTTRTVERVYSAAWPADGDYPWSALTALPSARDLKAELEWLAVDQGTFPPGTVT